MLAKAFCPRCKTEVTTNDEFVVKGGESFHDCRGQERWVRVKWRVVDEAEYEEELDDESEDILDENDGKE